MAKVVYVVGATTSDELVKAKVVSEYKDGKGSWIIGRWGTNKATLKKALEKELSK